ncbi:hypothetical protein [Sphingomonas sp.]|uniref:hypothetical protein n=1 Tax=Sphingomonas sp. TaxID=28214 RepID=UPI001B09C8D7|nr:hypothetical protein [Sphingomonas sp.]MBO9713685.1 hypothetical protein [Sphingomonas sp.]
MIALAILALAFQDETRPLITFSKSTMLGTVQYEVTIGESASSGPDHVYWFRVVRMRNDKVADTRWTDSTRCPGGAQVLRSLADKAAMLRREGSGGSGSGGDGSGRDRYALEGLSGAPFDLGGVRLEDARDSPLGDWINDSLDQLSFCG